MKDQTTKSLTSTVHDPNLPIHPPSCPESMHEIFQTCVQDLVISCKYNHLPASPPDHIRPGMYATFHFRDRADLESLQVGEQANVLFTLVLISDADTMLVEDYISEGIDVFEGNIMTRQRGTPDKQAVRYDPKRR